MLAVYTLTIFVGAFLLFLVQPMVAKLMLPMVGGSPVAWNAAMVFFQAVLLGGYLYAHLLSRLRSTLAQAVIHGVVLVGVVAALPIKDPRIWAGPGDGSPVWWLLGALAVCVGGPFFVLSTTGPLVQRWFAGTRHPSARDPYFLYAASNAGSMLALLAYPVLLEPAITLSSQRGLFTWGYIVFGCLVLACAGLMVRERAPAPAELTRAQRRERERKGLSAPAPEEVVPSTPPPTWRTRGLLVLLAFVPSSLSLGVTQHLTTDIAPVPMLWVLPLGVYLLTFVLAFSGRPGLTPDKASRLLPWLVLLVSGMLATDAQRPILAQTGLHLLTLFVAAMLCHGRLAALRPAPSRLTEFYLLIAVGGVVGGIFNSIVAPMVFATVLEYPIALMLVLMLRITPPPRTNAMIWLNRGITVLAPVAAVLAFVGAKNWLDYMRIIGGPAHPVIWVGPALLICAFLVPRRGALAAGLAGLLYAHAAMIGVSRTIMYRERTFFGVHRVESEQADAARVLMHGTTEHGMQILRPERLRTVPSTYFHPTGPIGDVFRAIQDRPGFDSVAVVGLGAGTLAAYGRPGERMTFYEIDPAVVRISRELAYFTYLRDSVAKIDIVLGDARLRMAQAPDAGYDLIILDAFSSDSIPMHLVTVEAIELYLKKLAPGGVLAFHITNRYLDLTPVLLGNAGRLGLVTLAKDEPEDKVPQELRLEGKAGSTWGVLCRDPSDAGDLLRTPNWLRGTARADTPVWTDDYSNILSVFFRR